MLNIDGDDRYIFTEIFNPFNPSEKLVLEMVLTVTTFSIRASSRWDVSGSYSDSRVLLIGERLIVGWGIYNRYLQMH